MRICGTESNEEIRKELGKRIRDMRLKMDIRQKEISKRTGISAETIRRIEKGENVKVDHLLDVLRELELLKNVEKLVPEQEFLVFGKKVPQEKSTFEDRIRGLKRYDIVSSQNREDDVQKPKQEQENPKKRKVLRVHRKYQRL